MSKFDFLKNFWYNIYRKLGNYNFMRTVKT